MAKPKIDELLIESALQPDLCRRLLESPDEVFASFDLTVEEREILRRPNHRLLPLLGAALARQMKSSGPITAGTLMDGGGPDVTQQDADVARAACPDSSGSRPCSSMARMAMARQEPRALPDTLMALTVVPCALRENGQFKGISYVMWANPLPVGADPASMPAPAGMALPGEPLAPLHAVIRISVVQSQDAAGNPQVSMWGSFVPAASANPPPESAGEAAASPFKSAHDSAPVRAAAAAVREASSAEKYDRLVDLLRALDQGEVR